MEDEEGCHLQVVFDWVLTVEWVLMVEGFGLSAIAHRHRSFILECFQASVTKYSLRTQ